MVQVNHKISVTPVTVSTVETAPKKKSNERIDVSVSLKNEPANSSAWKGKNKWCIFVHAWSKKVVFVAAASMATQPQNAPAKAINTP